MTQAHTSPAPRGARPRARLTRALALAAALALLAGLRGGAARGAETGAGSPVPPVAVTIDRADPGQPVPSRFLGLSFEVAALAELARDGSHGNLVALLRSLGPGMLRFGGVTADENIAWTDSATPRPAWASGVIGPADIRALGVLARRSGWSVLLTVGLAHYDPQAAAREVAAAHAALGSYLAAVEIGNEPDSLGNHGYREAPWTSQSYEEQVTAYREAIAELTPGVRIAGPDVSGSGVFPNWGFAEAAAQSPALLTGHHYPEGCAHSPSIAGLLSPETRGAEAVSLATYLKVARAFSIPFRMDETNSVSCGGVPGISNTYASALWASSYITQAMSAGTAGINLQGNPENCPGYTPLCATGAQAAQAGLLTVRPDWYALELTRGLIGDRPLLTQIAAPQPNLVAAAFAAPGHGLKLILIDDEAPGAAPLSLRVAVGAAVAGGSVLRLTGPSLQATGGVLLGGHAIGQTGALAAPEHPERAVVQAETLDISIAASSAALVTLTPPAPRSRPHRH
jgi:hypothetical protein